MGLANVHSILFSSSSHIDEESKQELSEDGVNATIVVQPTTSANETVVLEPTPLAEKSVVIPNGSSSFSRSLCVDVLEFDLMLNASDRANCSRCFILHKDKRLPYDCKSVVIEGREDNDDNVLDKDQMEKDSNPISFTLVMTSTYVIIIIINFNYNMNFV